MIKKTVLTLFFVFMGIVFGVSAKGYTLVIDAGHGGHDTGAKGASSLEKDINLKVALAFGQYVEQNCKDVNVIYTRKTDTFIPLKERANIANRNNADLFVSVHTNALPNGRIARGFEVYTLGMHRAKDNLDVAMRENSVIEEEANYKQTYQGFDPKSSESYIMFEFMQSANMRRSVELAKLIENSVCSTADRNNMGVHQAGFLVLRETSMPSCLIELGFITTPDEEEFLNTDEGIDKLANGIYKAFVEYKNRYPGKSDRKSQTTSGSNDRKSQPSAINVNTPADKPAVSSADKSDDDNTPSVPAKKGESTSPDKISTKVTPSKTSEPVKKVEIAKKNNEAPAMKPNVPVKKQNTIIKKVDQPVNKPVEIAKKPVETAKKPVLVVKKQEPAKLTVPLEKPMAGQPVFKVQIFAVGRQLAANDPLLKGHSDFDTYTAEGSNFIKYTIGSTTDYETAVQLRNSLRADFPQAYIVAFKDGKPEVLSQAINEYKKNLRKQSHNKK